MQEILLIFFGAVFFNNFVLNRFLGICPFLGVSKRIETSLGMGMAVAFVMTLASIITWVLQGIELNKLGLKYLQTITFILLIVALIQFVEMVLQMASSTCHKALGVFLLQV